MTATTLRSVLWRFRLAILIAAVPAVVCAAEGEKADDANKAAPAIAETGADPAGEASGRPWLTSLGKAYLRARETRQPILLRAGAEWCRFCRKLDEEIRTPPVQKELARWTLVSLDVDESPAEARRFGIGPIPALRILTPNGKPVEGRDGVLSSEQLAEWLKEHYEEAAAAPPEELTGDEELTLLKAVKLVRQFEKRDASLREAAIRRLMSHPETAAAPVVTAFAESSLAKRLAALELLQEWDAPVQGLDPWRPQTITEKRLDALNDWAAGLDEAGSGDEESDTDDDLSPEELAAARRMIGRMLAAEPAEAEAIRERLARFGRALLPEVYQRLDEADTDAARERLTALRYRLVASDALVLHWPGGLERLASTDAETRHEAADELARRATAADEPLLLELFADPSPLVREISLRTLREVGGTGTGSALVRLLDDPEPNVRAAVLKQLAEKPSRSVVPQIADYVTQETDPDLVVHAVRVFREAQGKAAAEALVKLLDHASWRVRAEAAEALGKVVDDGSGINQATEADSYLALIDVLQDEDSFVVSRAVRALAEADLVTAVEPLVETAERHPDLAVDVVEALSSGHKQRQKAIPHLREFCGHENPKVRAAAVSGLCSIAPAGVKSELRAALTDEEPPVRIAAAEAFFEMLENKRDAVRSQAMTGSTVHIEPTRESSGILGGLFDLFGGGGSRSPEPTEAPSGDSDEHQGSEKNDSPKDDTADPDEPESEDEDPGSFLRSVRAGEEYADWQYEMAGLLKPMLSGGSAEEKLAAALPLAALGHDAEAIPALRALREAHPRLAPEIAEALPWLLFADRKTLFDELVQAVSGPDEIAPLARSLAESADLQTAGLLWRLLDGERAGPRVAQAVAAALREVYFPRRSYNPSRAPAARRKQAAADAKPKAGAGPKWRRLAALSILLEIAADEAAALAQQIVDDETAAPPFRADAFQVLLLAQKRSEAKQTAVRGLASDNDRIRQASLAYLARGGTAVMSLAGGRFHLRRSSTTISLSSSSNAQAIVPEAPEGLTPETLRPFLKTGDSRAAAHAGYLLALLGRPDGLQRLIDYWRENAREDESWTRLVYRAIASLNDKSRIPLLREIYEEMDKKGYNSRVGEFYWTIRMMTGPEVLALRKRIRDEVGMQNLGSPGTFPF